MNQLSKIFNLIGIDRAIFFVILHRSWGVISGVVTLFLIGILLSPIEQGYYYTFASIMSIQIIFELGFGTVLTQFSSCEMSKLSVRNDKLIGDANSLSRLLSLVRITNKWSLVASILTIVIITPIGLYFFSHEDNILSSSIYWQYPWLFLVLFSGISIFITPLIAIADGCGFITKTSRMRFIQSIVSSVIVWFCLITDNGLFATAAMPLGQLIVGLFWIRKYLFTILKQAYCIDNLIVNQTVSWRKEIFPMQWRVGASWISGYFIFQLFNPIAFKYYGAEFAGKLGMSITTINLLMILALAWITTKMPEFGRLVAISDWRELNNRFKIAFKQSLSCLVILIVFTSFMLYVLNFFGVELIQRFLPTHLFVLLGVATIGNHVVACQANFIRIRKVEIHLSNAIITAIFMGVMLFTVGEFLPKEYMIILYCCIIWCVCVPHSTYIVFKFYKSVDNSD